jgi:DNA-binding SARP family transcriptional activator/tetratricopeptide (TPR) repeat protein
MLLLSAGHVVTVDRLLRAIYGEDLPPTSRSQAQISISALRRLFAAHGGAGIISTREQGYVLQAGDGQLDYWRFSELTAAARAARDAGQLDQAVASYRDALRLWRGPALAGLDSQLIRAAASRMDEQRVAALEDRLALELDLGRHHELVGELTELVAEFPLRERLRGQLILALYRCDRTAEALQAYRQARQAMIEDLGIEPGEQLQRLERDILRSDPALAPPGGVVSARPERRRIPGLLPTSIADFTDRAAQIEQVNRRLVSTTGDGARFAVPVVVIVGQGGVGKTCLAVRSAHGLASHFADGQLFADLHGGSAHPVSPVQVLERFLRALGVPGAQLPEGLDERAEIFRNLLAGRKVLVVLDDAADEGQVAPLLPGVGPAAVLVTSRGRLAGLAGAGHVQVDVFDEGTSLELLGHIAGTDRVRSQPRSAAAVAGQCGHLPLALRIAGARLAARPHRSIQQLADRLADETRRLDELRHGKLGVRASISVSYQGASEQARRLFRRLALLEMPAFSGWMSTALLGGPVTDAEDALDELVSAQLIEATDAVSGAHSHYRFHELVRVFALERLAAEEPAIERKAALQRALGALLYLAEEARSRQRAGYLKLDSGAPRWPLPGPLTEELLSDPLSWYKRERATLVSGIRQAARAGLAELCWNLAISAEEAFESGAFFDDWRETREIGLAAAQAARHTRGQAAMLYSRGGLHLEQHRLGQARQDFEAAGWLFRDVGDEIGLALVARNLAIADRLSGRFEDAVRGYEQALAAFRKMGNPEPTVSVLLHLARLRLERGEHQAATESLADALGLVQGMPPGRIRAQALYLAGEASLAASELDRAVTMFDQALTIVCDISDPVGQAHVLRGLGVARLRLGELGAARAELERALEFAGSTGEQMAEGQALLGLSELALASDEPQQAAVLAQQASDAFQAIGTPLYAERALNLLSSALAVLGDGAAATAAAAQATALRARHADGAQPLPRE